jgi:2-amino-4-hydroxy-6-hydroxymethyldihydropteridine diphosphokinase
MTTCLLALGANLGDRHANLRQACDRLRAHEQIQVARVSSYCSTLPIGGPAGQADFLNAAAVVETSLPPLDLLRALQQIENELGRVRGVRWDARAIDLDLLLYGRLEMRSPELVIPHPRLCFRRFVLKPAAEIAEELVYPVNGWTVGELLANVNRPENYIALCGDSFALANVASVAQIVRAPHNWADFRQQPGALEAVLLAIQQSAERLQSHAFGEGAWTVSDFWFEEFELCAATWFPGDRQASAAIERELSRYRQLIARPKLVAIGETPRLAQPQLAEMLHRHDAPPALRLPAGDPSQAQAEVLAAMQAMR